MVLFLFLLEKVSCQIDLRLHNQFLATMSGSNEFSDDDEDNIKVCQGLTDAERREIRKSQRILRKEIPDLGIDEARARNNAIHKKVRYIRESVLDAENLDEIAKKATVKVDQMVQTPRYDADRVINKLIEQCRVKTGGKSYFDWLGLGIQSGICFNAVPSQINFLNGPLVDGNEEVTVKQRAKRTRLTQAESDAEEERPDDVKGHTERGADQLSAVQKNIEDVEASLSKTVDKAHKSNKRKVAEAYGDSKSMPDRVKSKLKKSRGACAVELLFNPKSFTQTVENLYHYSFLVKEGKASLKVRDNVVLDKENKFQINGGPIVNTVPEKNKKSAPMPRQAIVSLTMESWSDLIRAYDVKASTVKHRGS